MSAMDLTSARGTKLSDIVIDHRPSTGRGKRLTLAQEGILRRLYEQELPSVPSGELPVKGFWVNLASRFREQTGREYSWLSVKRRAAGWRQKPLEIDRRLDASELGVGDSKFEPRHRDIARELPSQQDSRDSEQSTLPPIKPSPEQQDSNTLESSELEKGPGVGDWLQRSCFSGATDPSPDTSKKVRSPRMAQPRPRSKSTQRVSHPGYRGRSPSTTRRTKIISRRLHRQLASSSGSAPADEDVQLSHLSTRKPPEYNSVVESVGKDESENHARQPARSKRGESKVSNGLPASPHLSEQDDLPLAPIRIKRRRVAK
ncbi:unnamed protein product [Penicillium egyptiacum]|uniref:Uncharacterized protein n=1 Tax=Penicillium egyptiacum TaxID=1303716 RepID=A0A9W4P2H7_9EURO|nr:unnamed protein product [Penicillium egyptiacum]